MRRDTVAAFRARARATERMVDEAVAEVNAAQRAEWEERKAAARAERERLAALPAVPLDQIREAKYVKLRDGLGWHLLVKVNPKTVKVRKHGIDTTRPHNDVIETLA